MLKLYGHDTAVGLLASSRECRTVRESHRILAIRDILLGRSRTWVCEQYGATRETLRQWVRQYNAEGIVGLQEGVRTGRRCRLSPDQLAQLREKISAPPEMAKDGIGRWRAADVGRWIEEEFGVRYTSIMSICNLLHKLGQSWISGRPKHPQQAADAIMAFKKTPGKAPGNRRRPSGKDAGALVAGRKSRRAKRTPNP